jgi:hypothetical protein
MVIGQRLSLTTKIRTQFLLCSSIGVFAYIDQEVVVTTRCIGTPPPVKWKIDSRTTGHMKILPYMSVHLNIKGKHTLSVIRHQRAVPKPKISQ